MKNKICGIYKITNNLNGKSYVGQSVNCMSRWSYHKTPSKNVAPIDQAINEYGAENFTFKVEKECLPEELDFYEREIIKKYNTMWPSGYNRLTGGRGGFDVCKDTRRKIGEQGKGEKNGFYDHKHTEEVRKKLSASAKNRLKLKWITPNGEIKEMDIQHATQHHPDWVLYTGDQT